MDFETWWSTQKIAQIPVTGANDLIIASYKEIAKAAWEASREAAKVDEKE